MRLADLLAERGDLDEAVQILRAPGRCRRPGTPPGGWPSLLAERGDLDELRARADAGDSHAASRLADLLAERGDLDELRARGRRRRSTPPTGWPRAGKRGDLDEAAICAPADAGDGYAAGRLAELLAKRGDLDEAARPADAGD